MSPGMVTLPWPCWIWLILGLYPKTMAQENWAGTGSLCWVFHALSSMNGCFPGKHFHQKAPRIFYFYTKNKIQEKLLFKWCELNNTEVSRNTDDSGPCIALCASIPSPWLGSDYGKVILKGRSLDRAPDCRDNRTGGIKTTVWNWKDETQPTGLCWKVAHRYITITLLWVWKCWVIVFPCQCAQGALQQ